jgi:hypothetical protein
MRPCAGPSLQQLLGRMHPQPAAQPNIVNCSLHAQQKGSQGQCVQGQRQGCPVSNSSSAPRHRCQSSAVGSGSWQYSMLTSALLLVVLCSPVCMAVAQPQAQGTQTGNQAPTKSLSTHINEPRVVAAMAAAVRAGSVWAPLGNFTARSTAPASSFTSEPLTWVQSDLVKCINDVYEPKNMTWDIAMRDDLVSVPCSSHSCPMTRPVQSA